MPRSTHPIDAVQRYFRTADLPAAELALHVARGIVKDRKDVEAAKGPAGARRHYDDPTQVKKRTRGPNKPKPPKVEAPKAETPVPSQAVPVSRAARLARQSQPEAQTGQTVEPELVGSPK